MVISRRWAICLMTGIVLSGCQSVLNTAKVTSEAVVINEIIESGSPLNIIKSANITEQEHEKLANALAQYTAFRDKWWNVLKEPLQAGATMIALRYDYQEVVGQYHVVKGIVESHVDDYDEVQIAMLRNYQIRAELLHTQVMDLIDDGEKHAAITNAIDSVLIMLRIIK